MNLTHYENYDEIKVSIVIFLCWNNRNSRWEMFFYVYNCIHATKSILILLKVSLSKPQNCQKVVNHCPLHGKMLQSNTKNKPYKLQRHVD